MLTFRVNAISILPWVFCTNTALAIGLSEIQVHSNLGEPLKATVPILEAPNDLDATCFKVRQLLDEDLTGDMHAHVSIKKQSGEIVLVITTPQSINDPILQLSIMSDCNSLRREYVILLDPPQTTMTNDNVADINYLNSNNKKNNESIKKPLDKQGSNSKSKTKLKEKKPTERINTTTAPPLVKNTAPLPNLTISNGEPSPDQTENSEFALKLDTGLLNISQTSTNANIDNKNIGTELSDDSAALTHRLAHLEMQLVTLQKRNTELERANKITTSLTLGEKIAGWWIYILTFSILSGLAIFLRLKLKKNKAPSDKQALWPVEEISSYEEKMDTSPPAEVHEIMRFENQASDFNKPRDTGGTEINEDILDQAEVFVAHGRSNFAIQVLQDHLQESPKESPEPWLLLLDLLKRDGKSEEYAAASEACRQHFNIKVTSYSASASDENNGGIENYPHVLANLQQLWGKPSLEPYLDNLIYNQRMEPRLGFEAGAYRDLLFLLTIIKQKV